MTTAARLIVILFLIVSALVILAGCSWDEAARSTGRPAVAQAAVQPGALPVRSDTAASQTGSAVLPARATTCAYPSGWLLYQVPVNDTVYSVAARAGVSVDALLRANCLAAASGIGSGAWLYVPPQTLANSPRTFLPLGISAFVVDPVVVDAGGMIWLAWQAQGPVVRVRIGWMYQGQFIEEAANLPQTGTWQFQAPADGRESITFEVRASDGVHEVAAQTSVQVRCPQGWFFSPQPSECPLPPLVTTFYEQAFERGVIVYVPALRAHYVLVNGKAGQLVVDTFAPGMPLNDPALKPAASTGLRLPSGAIYYAWRGDEAQRQALGYALAEPRIYTGMLQRAVSPGGEQVYFSSASGPIYRFINGQAWSLLVPQ